MTEQNNQGLLTISEAADFLSCHPNTLRNWDNEGKLNAIRVGPRKDRRYKKSDLIDFLEGESSSETDFEDDMKIEGIFAPDTEGEKEEMPLFASGVTAGFPTVADDYVEQRLDLNDFLVNKPQSTFFLRVYGTSMIDAGIHSGDILVVDKSRDPRNNHVVVASIDGELTIKKFKKEGNHIQLKPANSDFSPIDVKPESDFRVWGVVTNVIHPILKEV